MTVNDLQNAVNQIQLSNSVKNKILYNCNEKKENTYSKQQIICVVAIFLVTISLMASSIFNKTKDFGFSINVYAMSQHDQPTEYKIDDKLTIRLNESNYYIVTSQNIILEAFEFDLSDDSIKNIDLSVNNGEFFELSVLSGPILQKSFGELVAEGYFIIHKNNQYYLFDDLKENIFSSSYVTKVEDNNGDFAIRSIGKTYTKNNSLKILVGVPFENNEIFDSNIDVDITFKDGKKMRKSVAISQVLLPNNNIEVIFSIPD